MLLRRFAGHPIYKGDLQDTHHSPRGSFRKFLMTQRSWVSSKFVLAEPSAFPKFTKSRPTNHFFVGCNADFGRAVAYISQLICVNKALLSSPCL